MADYKKGDGGYRLPAITDPERICIQLEVPNEPDHLRAFWGALWTLTWYSSWEKDDDKRGRDLAAVWKDVWFKARAANQDWDACLDCENEGCVEYSPQYIQEWFPNNPYISIPPGTEKKWYIAPEINLLGVPAGTVVTDIVNTQPGPGDPDLPRVRFYFSGTGVIEIHFHSVLLGGAAQIQVDGELLSLRYENLLADVFRAPPDTPAPVIHEVEITIPGNHFIDITMVPIFNDEITFTGFGGGLTKLVFCGFDNMYVEPQFRFTEACGLEQSNNNGATWNPVPGWETWAADCFTGPTGPAGPAGEQGPPGEPPDPFEDDRDIPPPTNVEDDDPCRLARRLANHIVDAYGIWANDIAYALYTQGRSAADLASDMENFLYSGSTGIFESAVTGDNYEFTNSWDFFVSSFFSAPLAGGVFWSRIVALVQAYQAQDVLELRDKIEAELDNITCAWVDALDDDLNVTQGEWDGFKNALAARIEDPAALSELENFLELLPLSRIRALARQENDSGFDCVECEIDFEWSATFDFSISDYGFVPTVGGGFTHGQHIPGVGWRSSYFLSSTHEREFLELTRLGGWQSGHTVLIEFARRESQGTAHQFTYKSSGGGTVQLPAGTAPRQTVVRTGLAGGTGFTYLGHVMNRFQPDPILGSGAAEAWLYRIRMFGNGTRPASLAAIPD